MRLKKDLDKNKWFQEKLNEIYNNKYILLNDYIGDKVLVKIKCTTCNEIFEQTPNHLIQGWGCKNCSNRKLITNKIFDDMLGLDYTRLEDVIDTNTPILIKHNICNYEWKIKPNNFKQGKRCPKCAGVLKKNENDIQIFLDKNFPNEYKVIGKYIKKDASIEILHLKCNHIITPSWNNIRNKKFKCKYCNMTSGELEIANILDQLNIDFNTQYKYKECKDKKQLPFDFQFILNNKEYIIEYDGRQHFEPVNDFGGEKGFKLTKKHDNIKNKFCEENNINLLRIKYETKNIKELIENFIN